MAIDVGAAAIDRATTTPADNTFIAQENPANETGTLDTVEVYGVSSGTITVGTFFGSGTSWTSRDSATFSISAGFNQETGLSIDVVEGDLIGFWISGGIIDRDFSGDGYFFLSGDQFGAGQQTYTDTADRTLSVHATGAGASAGVTRKIKIAGTFVDKPIKTKVAGVFVDKPIKIKVGGVFQ